MTIETFTHEGLVIRVQPDEASISVVWEGTSDMRDPDAFLAPILTSLIENAKGTGKKVVIDLSGLAYMNSATVSPLVRLMRDLDRSQVQTVIFWDNKVNWQRTNFSCMKTISRTLSRVAVESR